MADDVSSTAKPCFPITFTDRPDCLYISVLREKNSDGALTNTRKKQTLAKGLKAYPWMKWYFLIVLPLIIISIFIIELIA